MCGVVRGVDQGHSISPGATSWLVHRLTGTGALHHLLGLLLSHAALGDRLKQPEERREEKTASV